MAGILPEILIWPSVTPERLIDKKKHRNGLLNDLNKNEKLPIISCVVLFLTFLYKETDDMYMTSTMMLIHNILQSVLKNLNFPEFNKLVKLTLALFVNI